MGSFNISFRGSVAKDFKRLDRLAANRIMRAIEALQREPLPPSAKKLIGAEHTFRIRVGDYRVIYTLDKHAREIEIQRVRHRKDVYL